MGDSIEELARAVSPSLAVKLASSLEIDGNLMKASAKLVGPDAATAALLKECFSALGADVLAAVLRGFAAAATANATDLRAVWSGPTFQGDGDHTTAALAHLIDEAQVDVFASTYSAEVGSEFVHALWRSVARGVKTTVLLDSTIKEGKVVAVLAAKLKGARILTYHPKDVGYAIQHSKVVLVDSRVAFVTSANLSLAAAERNLETGVVIRDSAFASTMRRRFASLSNSGVLVEYPA
ncbi:DISARM system phospholipase D-like protein DrmC [Leifsonia naganoensis]|uniref:phospholipase D n=1 Tax=Leifsonia naganoensis TaxID=150025 RepID=A0A853DR31_9MICO|nr:phosphatidylserine/phosphatidylglycerophosphate/cardiolipin synthase-like enzyme [Leifsonia naganoensis]